jgi:hypothetical protein
VLELGPERARARFNRAVAYRLQGNLQDALREFDAIIEVAPEQPGAYYNRGLVRTSQGDHDGAVADFSRTLALAPDHQEAQARLRQVSLALRARKAAPAPAPPALPSSSAVPPSAPSSSGPAPSGPSPKAAPPTQGRPASDEDGVLRVSCPACGTIGALRWEKLGRLHTCRRCGRSSRLDPSGGLVEVVRTRDNKWVDREAFEQQSRRARATRFALRRLLPALALGAAIFFAVRLSSRAALPAEAPLPRELSPRVELFTRAWLKNEWFVMRRLVVPGEERPLYTWSRRHPSPLGPTPTQLGPDVRVEVSVVGQQEERTVKVTVRGVGPSPLELHQVWTERGGHWFFVVPER